MQVFIESGGAHFSFYTDLLVFNGRKRKLFSILFLADEL